MVNFLCERYHKTDYRKHFDICCGQAFHIPEHTCRSLIDRRVIINKRRVSITRVVLSTSQEAGS